MRVTALLAAMATATTLLGETPQVCRDCLAADIARLADPGLRGRECASGEEAAAAGLLEDKLQATGAAPAAPGGRYQQAVELRTFSYAAPPALDVGRLRLVYDRDFVAAGLLAPTHGRLLRIAEPAAVPTEAAGRVVFYDPPERPTPEAVARLQRAGAAEVLVEAPAGLLGRWSLIAETPPERRLATGPSLADPPRVLFLRPSAAARVRTETREGEEARLRLRVLSAPARTQNLIAAVRGSDPDADRRALLFSAHYDHLGAHGGAVYPGADDDATGVAAVLELARQFAHGPPPRRTVYFALFGCEEAGGLGSSFFLDHPPGGDLSKLTLNLEFEMLGQPDPRMPDALMLTGWSRSDLGPALAGLGARIKADPDPEDDFFRRSDNYALARRGVVAQTISAWPQPPTYHLPSDTPRSLDAAFVAESVESLVTPLRRLASSDFQPSWRPGQKP